MTNLEYPDKEKSGVSGYLNREEEWVTLKEAAEISGYSPDYIGELIRKGKIPGKQVYFNVAWLTTKKAILEYKEKQKKKGKQKISKKEKLLEFLSESKKKILVQFEILKLFLKTFKSTLLIFTVFIITLAAVLYFIVFSLLQKNIPSKLHHPEKLEKTEEITF